MTIHPNEFSPENRRESARRLIAEVMQRPLAERLSVQEICDCHPKIAPELQEEYRKAQVIHDALRAADEPEVASGLERLRVELCDGSFDDAETTDQAPGMSIRRDRIGRYRIERLLGEGGFGRVWLATDDQLGRRVAIKTPHAHRLASDASIESYLAEARVLAKFDHPQIVPVYDVGRTDEGGCFVVSKWIDGVDLANRLRAHKKHTRDLPRHELLRIVIEVAEALHYAHAHGVVHRDIKPANILLDTNDRPCLVDFGLALQEDDQQDRERCVGTPAYMSPEQARGESHRVDGRSDLFSLGVVLYEALTGHRPFHGGSFEALLDNIKHAEPRPPRQWDDAIAPDLERICLKALSKRATDRYTTGRDFANELRTFVAVGEAPITSREAIAKPTEVASPTDRDVRIVPKGLRCFDAEDADFFLELLPGPRDRDRLPEPIRRWKARIENADADESFQVGLVYGPSGCGKSSFVRAGLLPRLDPRIATVFVEATPDDTEPQLLKRILRTRPDLAAHETLPRVLAAARRGAGVSPEHKLLIVIDQFEQWLHGRSETDREQLVEALRQCDGVRLQCLLIVRDDFWLAMSRFLAELEIDLVQGRNAALIDLFDPLHARKVLLDFGRAYGRVSRPDDELTDEDREFLDQSVAGLAEDGKVIPVRLALFADLIQGRPWTTATLREIGGSRGVGVTFLEETFGTRATDPLRRQHERAARGVLQSLLPKTGATIKAHKRSFPELLELSGYGFQPREFKTLMRILDAETRMLTPADPPPDAPESNPSLPEVKYFQLTHDYLVPSLREWLTRKQMASPTGRAELMLDERANLWGATRQRRQLPSLWEWLTIRLWTKRANWTDLQRRMMRAAAMRNVATTGLWTTAAAALLFVGAEMTTSANRLVAGWRAATVPLRMFLGQEDAILPILAERVDPTERTRLIHGLSPMTINSERLLARAATSTDPAVKSAMLLAAGEMLRGDPRENARVSDEAKRLLVEMAGHDPDPGVHSAAEWTAVRMKLANELKRVTSSTDKQWYLSAAGHTMAVVPGPTRFKMGSPDGEQRDGDMLARDVVIRRSFSIATKETSVSQFQSFLVERSTLVGADGLPIRMAGDGDAPVTNVTWFVVAAYCNWLSEREGLSPAEWCFMPNEHGELAEGMTLAENWSDRRGYRLPTEAEWEFACRAGSRTTRPFGSEESLLSKYVHVASELQPGFAPVGSYKPNDLGLFDMLGNAAEWCLNTPDSLTPPANEPITALTPRAIRGGSFRDSPSLLRSAARTSFAPHLAAQTVGFRVARSYP